jgi:hypothetical protein
LDIFLSSMTGADGVVDAALDLVGVGAGGDILQALGVDGLGVDGGGGGAVAGVLGGLGGDLLDHLGAHVLVGVVELDLLGDGDAVLGDGGRAEGLLEDDDAAGGAEGDLDGVRELADALEDALAGVGVESDLLGSHGCFLFWICAPGVVGRGVRVRVPACPSVRAFRASG